MQTSSSNSRFAAYAATLAMVLLASNAPAVTRLSLRHALGALDLMVLHCSIGSLLLAHMALRLGRQRLSILIAAAPVLSLILGRALAGDSIRPQEAVAVLLVSAGIVLAGYFLGTGAAQRLAPSHS